MRSSHRRSTRRRRAAAGQAGASGPRAAGRVLAHAGQRQVLLDGVLRREGAPGGARQLHLPGDDRPRGPGRPDLAHVRRLRRGGREDAARQLGQGAAGDPARESPLRLQPDPQVQPAGDRALQRARRHHRHLGRGAPDAGGQVRAQHAPRAAQRLVHRLHRHAALQARRADPAHLRRLRLALRLQALRGRPVHGQAGLREPRREAGHRPARPERPDRRRRSRRPTSTRTRRRCWRSCSARTTRSSRPTTGWTSWPTISSSTAPPAGRRASRCWCASTRSPARGCSSASSRAGRPSSRRLKALIPEQGGGACRGHRRRRAGAPDGAARCAARPGAVDGEHDHRDHHQRGAERGPRLREVGLRHHPAPRGDEDRLRDARRQAGGRGGRLQGPAASRSASRSSARCG